VIEETKSGKVAEPSDGEAGDSPSPENAPLIALPDALSVKQLADLLQVSGIDVIKQLMRNGLMVNINQVINYETAAEVVEGMGYKPNLESQTGQKSASLISKIKQSQLKQGKKAAASLKPRFYHGLHGP